MTDLIPAIREGSFPPRNKAGRRPGFARTLAASFITEDDYISSYDETPRRTLVPLSLAEMLASPAHLIQEDAEDRSFLDPFRVGLAFSGLRQAAHISDALPAHEIDGEA
jgi:hypothetical protein